MQNLQVPTLLAKMSVDLQCEREVRDFVHAKRWNAFRFIKFLKNDFLVPWLPRVLLRKPNGDSCFSFPALYLIAPRGAETGNDIRNADTDRFEIEAHHLLFCLDSERLDAPIAAAESD